MAAAFDAAAAAFVLLGLVVMSIGVYGVLRMPDLATRMHAASKSVVYGVCALAIATMLRGDAAMAARAGLIAVLLLLTTPVASYAIARAARRTGEFDRARSTAAEIPSVGADRARRG